MSTIPAGAITGILRAVQEGKLGAPQELIHLIHDELRCLARSQKSSERAAPTFQTTELVNEAYLRLFKKSDPTWDDRHHFFWAASRAMHDILVERARRFARKKRGGKFNRAEFPEEVALRGQSQSLLELSEALERLERAAPEPSQVVMLRFFGGLTHDECAAVLGVSDATVRRRWAFAKAWLRKELSGDPFTEQIFDEPMSASVAG